MSWLPDYAKKIDALPFCKGHCDICKQKNVKVKTLLCNRHFFCRTCREFAPQFRRNDFNCKLCSSATRRREMERLQAVDTFLNTQTKSPKRCDFEEVAFNLDGTRIVTFDNRDHFNSDVDGDENKSNEDWDLKGNNDEWDNLLNQLTRDQTASRPINNGEWKKNCADTMGQGKVPKPPDNPQQPEPMKRATSYIKLVLPSADSPLTIDRRHSIQLLNAHKRAGNPCESNTCDSQCNDGVAPGSQCKITENPKSNLLLPRTDSSGPRYSNSHLSSNLSTSLLPRRRMMQLQDVVLPQQNTTTGVLENVVVERKKSDNSSSTEEIERGTSPCKFRRGQSALNWGMSSTMETEDLKEIQKELNEIEGPCHRSDGEYSSDSDSDNDDFWDL